MGRFGKSAEIAAVVAMVATNAYMTNQVSSTVTRKSFLSLFILLPGYPRRRRHDVRWDKLLMKTKAQIMWMVVPWVKDDVLIQVGIMMRRSCTNINKM